MAQKFVVVDTAGTLHRGFVHRVSASPYVLAVFGTAFRRLSAAAGGYNLSEPTCSLDFCDLKAVVVNPTVVYPESTVDELTLPYGLYREGTWWKGVMVPYREVPKSLASQVP